MLRCSICTVSLFAPQNILKRSSAQLLNLWEVSESAVTWLAETLLWAAWRGRWIGKLGRFLDGAETRTGRLRGRRCGVAAAAMPFLSGFGSPGLVSCHSARSLAWSESQRKATWLFWEQMRDCFAMYFILLGIMCWNYLRYGGRGIKY